MKTLTYAQAMIMARNGRKVRANKMSKKWCVIFIGGEAYCLNPVTGSNHAYVASEKDKKDDWEVMR